MDELQINIASEISTRGHYFIFVFESFPWKANLSRLTLENTHRPQFLNPFQSKLDLVANQEVNERNSHNNRKTETEWENAHSNQGIICPTWKVLDVGNSIKNSKLKNPSLHPHFQAHLRVLDFEPGDFAEHRLVQTHRRPAGL